MLFLCYPTPFPVPAEDYCDKKIAPFGTLTLLKTNNITKHQLYYYKKKLEKASKPSFHAIAIKPSKNPMDAEKARKDIHIQIGKANIFIPVSETAILKTILKELAATC